MKNKIAVKLAALAMFAAVSANATSLKWDGGGNGEYFSDPLNWEGDVAPAAGSDSYRLEFNGAANGKSLVNDIVGLSVTNVTFGGNAKSPVTISGEALSNCVTILNQSTAHHIFQCEVVCKSGITPDISRAANNYIEFSGGLTASALTTASPSRWCGKITMENSSKWVPVRDDYHLLVAPAGASGGTMFIAKTVDLNWFRINDAENVANTAKVEKAVCDGAACRFTWKKSNWSFRWYLVAEQLRSGGVLKVGEVATTGKDSPDLFHSYADATFGESGIIEVNKITNGGTTNSGEGDTTDQRLPYIWLNRGYRGWNSWTHAKPGTWAVGSGGLTFTSDCNAAAKYRVGANCGALLKSFGDWTLAAQGRGAANVALHIDTGATLEINTDHYVTGDETAETPATHKVTLTGRVDGAGKMLLSGGGSVTFNYNSTFTGGTVATNSLTLAVNNASRPGSGAVKMERGTTLLFPKAGVGTTADMGAITLAGDNTVVFSNMTSGVTAARAASLTLSDPATTTFAIEGESALAPGIYQLFAVTGGVAPDVSNATFAGTALQGVEYEILVNAGGVAILVPGEFDVDKPQMVKSGAMSDAANWLGMKKPSTDALNAEIVFLPSVTNAVNDMGEIPVTKISFQATVPVTVSGAGKFTEVTTIETSASVHHTLGCKVECKNGVTPTIPNAENNYVKFTGGLVTPTLAKPTDFGGAACYYMGKISITNSSWEVNLSRSNPNDGVGERVHILGGSEISAKSASLNFVNIHSNAVFTVQNLTAGSRWYAAANSSNYMGNWGSAGPWKVYWTRLAENCDGKIVVTGSIDPGSGYDCFLPEGTASNRVVIAKGIVNSSTTAMTGNYTAAPYIFLNRGKKDTNGSAYGLANSTGEFKIALGSGGLSVKKGANSYAKFIVGADNTICSYEDWAIAAHPTSGNTVLEIGSSKTLTIDTGHYAVGDPEIDDGATAHTVTVNGVIGGAGNLRIVGGGTVEFNSNCSHSGWTRVENGVAILKSGASPIAGALSVWGNGTMVREDSGTVTVGGGLFVGDNSTLKFTINNSTDTNNLVVSYVSNTIETDDKFVNVYVDLDESQDYASFTNVYTLVTVTGDTKLQDEDLSKYKLIGNEHLTLAIEGGNLVVKRKPFFYIKIADQGDSQLEVPWNWPKENGIATTEETIVDVAAKLARDGENGIPAWQSYCLGLEPTNSQSVVLCEAAADQSDPGRVAIKAANINIPEGLEGVEVSATLERKILGGEFTAVTNGTFSSGAIVLTTPEIDPGLSFFA